MAEQPGTVAPMTSRQKDLPHPVDLPDLDWSPESAEASLAVIRDFAIKRASDAVAYYQLAKRPKKRWAIRLRMGALLTAGAAGIMPILSQIFRDGSAPADTLSILLAPAWASILLALAAGAVAVDRFFGFSSAWMRFMASELRVRRAMDEFELDWTSTRAGWSGQRPDTTEVQQMIQRCRTFLDTLAGIVKDETEQWISEFRETIRQLDETARAAATAEQHGGIHVTVPDGATLSDGWTLSVDGGPGREYHGNTAAISALQPGIHTVRVRASIDGRAIEAETAVAVARGAIAHAELVLDT